MGGDGIAVVTGERLRGRAALVTGAGSGIGAATVRRLASEGAAVTLAGRRREPLETVAASVDTARTRVVCADVTDEGSVAELVEAAVEHGGERLDVVVNNAGIGGVGSVHEIELDTWRRVIDVDLNGAFLVMRHAHEHLLAARGSVVNVSSVAGLRAAPESAAYCVAKAALIMLTQQAALDWGPEIRVNAVCPGWVRTPMADSEMGELAQLLGTDREGAYAAAVADVPAGRAADPDEIAATVAFLASDDASFVTAAVLAADGGSVAVDVATTVFAPADG